MAALCFWSAVPPRAADGPLPASLWRRLARAAGALLALWLLMAMIPPP